MDPDMVPVLVRYAWLGQKPNPILIWPSMVSQAAGVHVTLSGTKDRGHHYSSQLDWTMNPDMVLDSSLAQISPWYRLAMQLT